MKNIIAELKNPAAVYRGHPFWSWNDKLDPEELRRQIREMQRVGLGGYFMHARGGLITEYLSDDWFDCIKACIDEGKKTGMESWSYDENGWPSGFGGGIVSGMGDRFHVRWLICGRYDAHPEGQPLAFYGVKDGKCRFLSEKIRAAKAAAKKDEAIWYVAHEKNVNYVDIMSEKVVDAFIKCTYDEYSRRLGDDFGGAAMPGFFTDEPQFARCKIPYSYSLPKAFEELNGYPITDGLLKLFFEYEGYEEYRFDFWKTVSKLYTESFGKKIFDWCNQHNCRFTGHAMMEDSLYAQMACTAGVMPLYEYMHVPGMDWLGRSIASPLIPKQVGSVAKQLGKKHVLSETFAMCGWDVSFEELKWIAEWQYLNGINFMCQHLESYSIRGLRKRDYPPSMFYQSPWWDDYKAFNDYFARLGKIVADSDEQADVLLIHPMHTGYIAYNGQNCPEIQKYDGALFRALGILAGNHVGYHLGDECIMKTHGSVDGASIKVGLCTYHSVVLPAMKTLDASTFALLNEFSANGGKIYSLGELPSLVEGRPNDELAALLEKVIRLPEDGELLTYALVKSGLKNITVSDHNGEITSIHCRVNISDGGKIWFFQNQNKDHGYNAKLVLDTDSVVRILNLDTLEVTEPEQYVKDGKTTLSLTFAPMQSYTIVGGADMPEVTAKKKAMLTLPLANKWFYDGGDDNALTLDTCQYILGDGDEYSEPKNILDIMEILLSQRANDKIKLRFTFDIASDARLAAIKTMRLVSELTDEFTVRVNGGEVKWDGTSWWTDRAFKSIDIRKYVRLGRNEIIVDGAFFQRQKVYDVLFGKNVLETERNKLTYDTELESLYLVGDFVVKSESGYTEGARRAIFTDGGFVISDRKPGLTFDGGEIVTQGFPFFAGKIRMSQFVKIKKSYGKRIAIRVPKPYAALAKVYVDDKEAGKLLWSDYEVDISDYVKPGDVVKITIEPVISNRNLMGPHHNPQGEPYGISPMSFAPHGNYSPSGWRERYCFVKAGLGE